MSASDPLIERMQRLSVSRLGDDRPAGLLITSLPVPRHAPVDLALAGRPTAVLPLGEWPGGPDGGPRRLLMVADGGDAPDQLAITTAGVAPTAAPPTAELSFLGRNADELVFWENHALKVEWGGRAVELVIGLRTKGLVYWWQCCKLVVLEETPACRVIEIGGAIPLVEYGLETFASGFGHANPYLHKHLWLNGHIYARLHANGVCEIFAHHVNSKFFDDGLPLEDAVPVIGIRTDAGCAGVEKIAGAWDGTRNEITLGAVRFDLTETAHLATPERPGRVDEARGFVVLQPYQGVEVFGGSCPTQLCGDPYLYHAEQQIIPRGMARTLRFSFSLSPNRAPRVARYLAPAWWYGACEEFMPAPFLPVSNAYDEKLERERDWLTRTIHLQGFEDGCVSRAADLEKERPARDEPGWEGEVPHAQFLSAWRSGDAVDYDLAMRSAYYINDVIVDHATNTYRMLGYPFPAIALPHARVAGSIAAYLETGDPYLYDTAEAVTEAAFRIHKNSWPRAAIGRDACFIRGAVMLYRYFNLDYFRRKARQAIADVIAVQRPNGTFGDQAGGTGIHQWGMYITKPWMGCMATNGLIDYLELLPDDDEVAACVKRFADWLMRSRLPRDGTLGWAYQHDYAGQSDFVNYATGGIEKDHLPTPGSWHMEYFARLMTFCALRYGNPDYFAAWEESYQANKSKVGMDHGYSTAMQFLPWVQAWLWQARVTETGVTVHPALLGDRAPDRGTVLTPDGLVEYARQAPVG